jgi:Bacterial PH domain/Short C-terminal domain
MTRYADSLLANGEVIAVRTRQHWLSPVAAAARPFVIFVAAVVIFILSSNLSQDGFSGTLRTAFNYLGIAGVIIAIAWIGLIVWRWSAQDYMVTNLRVIKVEGIINKHSADSSLEKINDAVLDQGIFGRLLGFGDLDILTANEESVDRYKWLNKAASFKKEMLNQKVALESGYGQGRGPGSPAAAAAAAPANVAGGADEVTDTLSRLADLRDRGAISPAEYEAKKAELLGRL